MKLGFHGWDSCDRTPSLLASTIEGFFPFWPLLGVLAGIGEVVGRRVILEGFWRVFGGSVFGGCFSNYIGI